MGLFPDQDEAREPIAQEFISIVWTHSQDEEACGTAQHIIKLHNANTSIVASSLYEMLMDVLEPNIPHDSLTLDIRQSTYDMLPNEGPGVHVYENFGIAES